MNFDFAELGALFEARDRRLFLVGGSVRDMVMGRTPKDLDFTTDALPDEIEAIFGPWADAVWDMGRRFGTIAAKKGSNDVEITTFRFDGPGRKPEVVFTDSLQEDLQRRDFTINAMAMPVDHLGLHCHAVDIVDPFGGIVDIVQEVLDTPMSPERSFGDDPLRMMRAARFAAQVGFKPADRVLEAMRSMAARIREISAERIAVELDKTLMGRFPEAGLQLLADSGLASRVLPEWDGQCRMLRGGSIKARWADLLSGVDPARVRARLRALRMSSDRIRQVAKLVELVQRFSFFGASWSDQVVRRLLADAGPLLGDLIVLLDDEALEARIDAVVAAEGLPEPFLTGQEIIEILNVTSGPIVGEAKQFLWGLRLESGKLDREDVEISLRKWFHASQPDAILN